MVKEKEYRGVTMLDRALKEPGRLEAFLCEWTKGVWEGLSEMDEKTVKRILRKSGEACARIWIDLYGYDPKLYDMDSYISAHDKKPGNRCKKEDDSILYEFKREQCVCPLVSEGIVKLTPKLCSTCATNWFEFAFGIVAKGPVRAELIKSLACGDKKCIFRIHLK